MIERQIVMTMAAALLLGCGGNCIPKEAVSAASLAVNRAPSSDVRVVHSSDELRAAIGNEPIGFPQPRTVAQQDPAENEAGAKKRLDDFIAATNFGTSDVALVRAGDARAVLRAMTTTQGATLYFMGVCSACGGGNPGSTEDARAGEEAARAERTELVRIPKGSRVVIHVCSTECGTCPTNVP